MRIGYLDCGSGASGDMLLGALLGAGWPEGDLREIVERLGVTVRLAIRRVDRQGVPAVRVELQEDDAPHARPYSALAEILGSSRIAVPVREISARILRRLAEVEAEIHSAPVDQVHLHELGGLDTLVDLVGVVAGVHALGVGRLVASPINVGRGWVEIRHGAVPVPAPATAAFLEGLPIYAGETEGELLTPTGAALLSALVTGWGLLPPMRLERIGAGAGAANPARANVLRLFVGEALADLSEVVSLPGGSAEVGPLIPQTERLVLLETAIDDMNPQLYPHVTSRLLEAGALEVTTVPAVMKKGRPGHLLRVLAPPERSRGLAGILFAETTTIGVRTYEVTRLAAGRRIVEVQTEFGIVPVKIASDASGVLNVSPEFEACRTLAERHRVPVKRVLEAAHRAAAALEVGARSP